MPNDPDRSHLADAIHSLELIRLADEELPAARETIERSKTAALTARMELDRHQQWLGQHQQLYAQAVTGCDRRLKRQAFIKACKRTAWLPIQFLASGSAGLFHTALAYPSCRWLRAKLKTRIQELEHRSEQKFPRLQTRIQALDRRGLR